MSNNLNIPNISAASDTVEIKINADSAAETNSILKYAHPANRNPSEWRIEVDGEEITAVNNTSRETFKGLIEDFNKILRG